MPLWFTTLDEIECHLDRIMEAWDPIDEDAEGNMIYECTPDGEIIEYLAVKPINE